MEKKEMKREGKEKGEPEVSVWNSRVASSGPDKGGGPSVLSSWG